MKLAEDPWLAERLGKPAFTVLHVADLDTPLPDRLEPGFYQARVAGERVDLVRALEGRGFYVTNAGVTLGRAPGELPAPDGVEVRDADAERDRALLDVAESSFHSSRFHLDPQMPEAAANAIKRAWVESYLAGRRGERLLAAFVGEEPAGFLAVIAGEDAGVRLRLIDLIAVTAAHRGSGAGTALVSRFLADSSGACDEVRVGTQAANPGATRFYERLGFRTLAMAYDLHMHV